MHELSIAQGVAEVALRHAGDRMVTRVELRVGHLRQVVPSALSFAWEMVTPGTPLEGAELCIEEIEAVGRCRECGARAPQPGFPLACPACGSLDVEVVAGEELLVDTLELEEIPIMSGGTR
jgi:hydrogenase nickel incorporation protein HypA/HybF